MKVQDIHASDRALWAQYVQDFINGNYTAAKNILDNEQLDTKKVVAAVFNDAASSITALQQLYYNGVEVELSTQIANFNQLVANMANKKSYDATVEYTKGNFVVYDNEVYVYINNAASAGNLPTNTTYWLYLGLRGKQGIDGIGIELRYAWSSIAQYNTYDAVTYKDTLYYAVRASIGVEPGTSDDDWVAMFSYPKVVIYTGPIIPAQPYDGLLWFASIDPYTFDEVGALDYTFDAVSTKNITFEQINYGGW